MCTSCGFPPASYVSGLLSLSKQTAIRKIEGKEAPKAATQGRESGTETSGKKKKSIYCPSHRSSGVLRVLSAVLQCLRLSITLASGRLGESSVIRLASSNCTACSCLIQRGCCITNAGGGTLVHHWAPAKSTGSPRSFFRLVASLLYFINKERTPTSE